MPTMRNCYFQHRQRQHKEGERKREIVREFGVVIVFVWCYFVSCVRAMMSKGVSASVREGACV